MYHCIVHCNFVKTLTNLTDLGLDDSGTVVSCLKEAVELGRITELESHVDEVAQISTAGGQLAEHLRGLANRYEFEEILVSDFSQDWQRLTTHSMGSGHSSLA